MIQDTELSHQLFPWLVCGCVYCRRASLVQPAYTDGVKLKPFSNTSMLLWKASSSAANQRAQWNQYTIASLSYSSRHSKNSELQWNICIRKT